MNGLVSVIIPVYNVEEYVGRCIESVLNQNFKNMEILLVDDGSKDLSGKICDQYAEKDNRIRVIHKENGGLGPARNTALDIAKGEYVFFIDSDDYILPGIINKLYEAVQKESADIACCGYQSGKSVYYCNGTIEIMETLEATKKMLMCEDMDANAVCKLYRTSLFDGIRYPACAYEVVPVTYKVFLRAKRIVNIKENGYYIEKRPGSITRSTFGKNNVLYLTLSQEMQEDIHRNYSELDEAAEVFYLNALITMAEKSKEDMEAVNTDEYKYVNNEFRKKLRIILKNSKITKRKKMISLLVRTNLYVMVKKIYNKV